jgi:diguanylate cyclase (GGDEF)-like protein
VFAGIDAFRLLKDRKTNSLILLLFAVFFTCIGSTLDFIFKENSLVWPGFVSALLYMYFFIIQNDSKIDSLTGLSNRYSFNEFINKIANIPNIEFRMPFHPRRRNTESKSGRKRKPESYSIVMIDMDHLKMINDTLGHLEGDNALRDMAQVIKNCVRQSDFAARYGGDEFVLAARSDHDITILLGRIQSAIDEINAKNERPYKLQISYGYDTYAVNSGRSINEFLKHIDGLMYKHKNERRRSSDKEDEKNAKPLL